MMLFLSADQFPQWLGESERHAALEGSSVGECLLLLHAALARFADGAARRRDRRAGRAHRRATTRLLAALGPETPWLAFLIGMLFKTDRLDAAAASPSAALAEARRIGSAGGFAIASVWLAWIALRRGDGEAAEAHARAAVDAAPPALAARRSCACGLAEVLIERAQLDEAARSSTPRARTDAVAG